jgi:hypothetical protein
MGLQQDDYTVKIFSEIPVPSRDVNYQTLKLFPPRESLVGDGKVANLFCTVNEDIFKINNIVFTNSKLVFSKAHTVYLFEPTSEPIKKPVNTSECHKNMYHLILHDKT